jgi:hypothetical protein
MTRATMLAALRRRIHDPSGGEYSDAELNEMLNQGCLRVYTRIEAVSPGALITIARFDLRAGDGYYAIPRGAMNIVEVGVADTDHPTGWAPLTEGDYSYVRERNDASAYSRFARLGNYIFLQPTWSEDVTNGGQIIYVPSPTMDTGDSEPPFVPALHFACVLIAHMYLAPELGEQTEPIAAVLNPILDEIPLWYKKSGGGSDTIRLDVEKGY